MQIQRKLQLHLKWRGIFYLLSWNTKSLNFFFLRNRCIFARFTDVSVYHTPAYFPNFFFLLLPVWTSQDASWWQIQLQALKRRLPTLTFAVLSLEIIQEWLEELLQPCKEWMILFREPYFDRQLNQKWIFILKVDFFTFGMINLRIWTLQLYLSVDQINCTEMLKRKWWVVGAGDVTYNAPSASLR